VRKSLKRLSCTIKLQGSNVQLAREETVYDAYQRKPIASMLREAKDEVRLNQLLEAKDQGRVFNLVSKSADSNHWIARGSFISFAEYRFAVRARLNLLPTKTVEKRAGNRNLDVTCPKCHAQPETLGHVLNACTPNTGLMREWHNLVLKRLVKATPATLGDRFVEQKVPGSPDNLRPDFTVINNTGEATIVDVTIPFESCPEAFDKARAEKLTSLHH